MILDLDRIFDPARVRIVVAARLGWKCAAPSVVSDMSPLPRYRGVGPDDLPLDLRVAWEERSAIKEYCGRIPRAEAEAQALEEVLQTFEATKRKSGRDT